MQNRLQIIQDGFGFHGFLLCIGSIRHGQFGSVAVWVINYSSLEKFDSEDSPKDAFLKGNDLGLTYR